MHKKAFLLLFTYERSDLKSDRRKIVKGDNIGFIGISNGKIRSAIIQTHSTSWDEEKSVNSIAQR
jgi:hypothetical protein